MVDLLQPSFAKGEISPSLYGRVDTALYRVALRKAYNAVIHPQGGASNRAGLYFLAPVKTHTYAPRLIPFEFSGDDQYILEFGDAYMRVIRNDSHVVASATAKAITGITAANPVVVTSATHGFTNGMEIYLSGIVGMTELNGRRFIVANKTTDTFELTDQVAGTDINGTQYSAYTSGGTAVKIYEIATPYAIADVPEIVFVQSADVMTFTHVGYPVQELRRTDHDAWAMTEPDTAPLTAWPTEINFIGGTVGDKRARYAVTALNEDESLTGIQAVTYANAISAITKANPAVVTTSAAHGYHTNIEVYLTSIGGMTQVNNRRFKISVLTTTTFELVGEDSTGHTTYTSGGVSSPNFLQISLTNISGISRATAAVVTLGPHQFAVGDIAVIDDVVGMTEINGKRPYISAVTATTATLGNLDSSGFTAYASGGAIWKENTAYTTVTWTAVTGAKRYIVYKEKGGLFGKIGETDATSFLENNLFVDVSISPPKMNALFTEAGEWPGAVGYYEQRKVFGGADDSPDQSFYTRIGSENNHTNSIPLREDDAFNTAMTSRQYNRIRHYVPGNDLIVLTTGGEWRVNAGTDSGFSATTIRQKPQSYWGSSYLPPIVADTLILFLEENRTTLRTLGYSLTVDGYSGVNLTMLARHLTENSPIVDWCYANAPDSRLHMVREDGRLITLTFDQEQEVVAWTQWETAGTFKHTAVLRHSSDEQEDKLYFVVNRTINGRNVHYIERLAARNTGAVTVIPGTGLSALIWQITGPSVVDEGTTGTYTISYSNAVLGSGQAASITAASANGTATATSDYTALSTTLTFTSGGATSKTIAVSTIEDTAVEGTEGFTVSISNPSAGTISTGSVVTTIVDNDTAGPTRPTNIGTPTTQASATNQSAITVSHTVAANTDLLTVRIDGWFSNELRTTPGAVTFGGVAMTRVIHAERSTGGGSGKTWSDIWTLTSPSASTANVVITQGSGHSWQAIHVRADNWDNVEIADPIGATDEDTGDLSLSIITETANPFIIGNAGTNDNTPVPSWGSPFSQIWSNTTSDNDLSSGGAHYDGATDAGSTVAVTITADANRKTAVMAEIRGTPA